MLQGVYLLDMVQDRRTLTLQKQHVRLSALCQAVSACRLFRISF
jgi:hypothetical protein